jgi:hypothetical protein
LSIVHSHRRTRCRRSAPRHRGLVPSGQAGPNPATTAESRRFSVWRLSTVRRYRGFLRAPARRGRAFTSAPLPFGLRHSHICWPSRPPPPCGEDRLGRRPGEEGVAGHGAPYRRGTQVCQPQGPGLTDHVGLAPAADAGGPASTGSPMPGAPLPALPHKGGGELRAGFV